MGEMSGRTEGGAKGSLRGSKILQYLAACHSSRQNYFQPDVGFAAGVSSLGRNPSQAWRTPCRWNPLNHLFKRRGRPQQFSLAG
ncbi:hypothetical protein MES5069_1270031 [Mesorhizobium escarrei]|uniref:Uncharacterized protein n=1 Tax=Mesorhizobium escarrei TaxID=666018 RepID=A0ABN8JGV3_9HYPH|nr:hypothetical protein MES5069_1270031 [Mesorhizobium escarrei]